MGLLAREAGPVPLALTAATVKRYVSPLVRPTMVRVVEAALKVCAGSTKYPTIGVTT